MVIISTPASSNIKLIDVYMTAEQSLFGGEKKLPPVFPSGVTELFMAVIFSPPPPNGTQLSADVSGSSGAVELENTVMSALSFGDSTTVTLTLKPISGKFVDGPYQAILSVNGTAIAELNWTVGTP
jgi:hypothetical protein